MLLAQALLVGTALAMGILVAAPWLAVAGMGVLGVLAVVIALDRRLSKWSLLLAWIATLVVWRSFLLGKGAVFTPDNYFAALGWVVAGAILLAGSRLAVAPLKTHWNVLGMAWAFLANLIWILAAYLKNLSWPFHVGLLFAVMLLVVCRLLFRLSSVGTQAINTPMLFLVALPVADAFLRPSYHLDEHPDTGKRYYSYEVARKDPAAFKRWWYHFVHVWEKSKRDIFVPDPEGVAPVLLRPGSQTTTFESKISINHLGFRGPEIDLEKGEAYRIVALGESTTFGHTLRADDVPWPELLQQLIVQRLKPDRPVQVINAGIPAYTLELNLRRLNRDILPLKPDMIISYHGYNGFNWLDPALPSVSGRRLPTYERRPLKLLADCEYRLKLIRYKQSQAKQRPVTRNPRSGLMDTQYARLYERLVQVCQAHGVDLVLANFSMAVNEQSDPEVVGFYQAGFPSVQSQIRANQLHSLIIEQLGLKHPDIHTVDTHPGLDGEYDKFIDLVHFTQEGREQLAQTIFSGIEPLLETELGSHQQ